MEGHGNLNPGDPEPQVNDEGYDKGRTTGENPRTMILQPVSKNPADNYPLIKNEFWNKGPGPSTNNSSQMGEGEKSSRLTGQPLFPGGPRLILTLDNDDGEDRHMVWDGTRLVNYDVPVADLPIYKCSYCFQAFKGSSALSKHLQSHSLEEGAADLMTWNNLGRRVPPSTSSRSVNQSSNPGVNISKPARNGRDGDKDKVSRPKRIPRRTPSKAGNKSGSSPNGSATVFPEAGDPASSESPSHAAKTSCNDDFALSNALKNAIDSDTLPIPDAADEPKVDKDGNPITGNKRGSGRNRSKFTQNIPMDTPATEESLKSTHEEIPAHSADASELQNEDDVSKAKTFTETTRRRRRRRVPSNTANKRRSSRNAAPVPGSRNLVKAPTDTEGLSEPDTTVEPKTDGVKSVKSKTGSVSGKTGNPSGRQKKGIPSKSGTKRGIKGIKTGSPVGSPGIYENIEIVQSNGTGSTPRKQFRCKLCDTMFSERGNATRHIKLVHLKEKPHQCPICFKTYSLKQTLEVHMNYHNGIKPYKCHICPSTFYQAMHLKLHLLVHSGVKPYKCDKCDNSYYQRYALTKHQRSHN